MDVNVWGVARVTTAMLPLMRHTGGRIVVMASGLGRIMQPSRSPYGKIIPSDDLPRTPVVPERSKISGS